MTSSEDLTKRRRIHDFSETVIVKVGPGKKEFLVHTTFLRNSSSFFESALRNEWLGEHSKAIDLPEAQPEIFASSLHWIYTGNLAEVGDVLSQGCNNLTERASIASQQYDTLRDRAIIADVLDDRLLRNAVVDAVLLTIETLRISPGGSELAKFWSNLPATSKLRRMFVDFYAAARSLKLFAKPVHRNEIPLDFVLAVLIRLKNDRTKGNTLSKPTFPTRCCYHEHTEEEPKCN